MSEKQAIEATKTPHTIESLCGDLWRLGVTPAAPACTWPKAACLACPA